MAREVVIALALNHLQQAAVVWGKQNLHPGFTRPKLLYSLASKFLRNVNKGTAKICGNVRGRNHSHLGSLSSIEINRQCQLSLTISTLGHEELQFPSDYYASKTCHVPGGIHHKC